MFRSTTVAIAFLAILAANDLARGEGDPFAAGMWNFTLEGAYTNPIHYSHARTYDVNASIGKFLWDDSALNLELSGWYADQPDRGDEEVVIGGIGVLGRWHFLRFDRWSIFLDGGGGVTYADKPFPTYPYDGTHFNLTGKVGFGASYRFKDHKFITGGVRYFHISNAVIHGQDQNPTYDSLQYWGGMMWTW